MREGGRGILTRVGPDDLSDLVAGTAEHDKHVRRHP